jgi:thymidylate synthase (FAD)
MPVTCYYCNRWILPPFGFHSKGDCEEAYALMLQKQDPLNDGISSIELLGVFGTDMDVVNAARVSHNKWSDSPDVTDKDKRLIRFLLREDPRHTSPFEHNQFKWRVKAPIFVFREWHRYRHNSYNEVSGRYVEFGKDFPINFYIPAEWREQSSSNRQASGEPFISLPLVWEYEKACEMAVATYKKLVDTGVTREQARGVLPLCLYSEMICTMNLLSLFHFLAQRLHKDAQQEIREYAAAMLQMAEPYFPASFEAWRSTQVKNPLVFREPSPLNLKG